MKDEMSRTFNCGLGMILIVGADKVNQTMEALKQQGEDKAYIVGSLMPVQELPHRVVVENMDASWAH
jgi:phosphoribosylaminoimidazole (AIR) synthetase